MNGLGRSVCVGLAVLALAVACASSDNPGTEPQPASEPTTSLEATASDLTIEPATTMAAATTSVELAPATPRGNECPPVAVIADMTEAIAAAVAASQAVAEDHAADAGLLIDAWEGFNPRRQESFEMLESIAPDPDANNQTLRAESEAAAEHALAVVFAAAESHSALDEGNRQAHAILAAVANGEVDDLGELDASVVRALLAYEAALLSAEAAEARRADAQAAYNLAAEEYESALSASSAVGLPTDSEEAVAERAALIESFRAGIAASDALEEATQAFFALYEEVLWATLNDRCN